MIAFARLVDSLALAPRGSVAAVRLVDHFRTEPDPERGWAAAVLTGALPSRRVRSDRLRALAAERIDSRLLALSQDYVGDVAEALGLAWPAPAPAPPAPRLSTVARALAAAPAAQLPALLPAWLDGLDAPARRALLKLVSGGLLAGVSPCLVRRALAAFGGVPVARIEEVWHGVEPPYEALFAWLERRAARPRVDARTAFRPFMRATPLERGGFAEHDPDAWRAEWKWDGVRVQIAAAAGRLYARSGDEIGAAFPEVLAGLAGDAVLEGELLVVRDDGAAPFDGLRRRLGRKTASRRLLDDLPARVRLFDILYERGRDLRRLSFDERRARLEAWHAGAAPARLDLSPLLPFADRPALERLRARARRAGVAGLMLKRRDGRYEAGERSAAWLSWTLDPLRADCVLMYAGRGRHAVYTLGCWRGDTLVPVARTAAGTTAGDAARIDEWVGGNTVERHGPLRAVAPGLVFEIAFDSVAPAPRRKAGLALRAPRIVRVCWDKPPERAAGLETLSAMLR